MASAPWVPFLCGMPHFFWVGQLCFFVKYDVRIHLENGEVFCKGNICIKHRVTIPSVLWEIFLWYNYSSISLRGYWFILKEYRLQYMGVSKSRVKTPKWMVIIMVPNPMNKWMIWGAKTPPIFGSTPKCWNFSTVDDSAFWNFWVESLDHWKHPYVYSLEVNHHFKNGGSFWKMINPY